MFNLFQKNPQGQVVELKLSGLHCTSCSLTIDSEIEDIAGVLDVKTSYANQITKITYDPARVDPAQFAKVIQGLGYKVLPK
jgi:copper chaperone CopZ